MKISKIRAVGIGCLAATTGLVTSAALVLSSPADAANKAHVHPAAHEAVAPATPTSSGNAFADNTSVASGNAKATNGSVASGDAIADNGSVASGCSVALDHSTASGGPPCPVASGGNNNVGTTSAPANAVNSSPTFAG
jgi:hypothetical protein